MSSPWGSGESVAPSSSSPSSTPMTNSTTPHAGLDEEPILTRQDLVVGYMGVPKYSGISMSQHPQYITVRNEPGREMLSLVENLLETSPTVSSGNRQPYVMETVKADDQAKSGKASPPAPRFVGDLIAFILNLIGPKGLEFARYSLDYHTICNFLYVHRTWGELRAEEHMPSYAKKLIDMYNKNGQIDSLLSNK